MVEYGNYKETLTTKMPLTCELKLSFRPLDLMNKWQRCGLTADFISQFETIGQSHIRTKNVLSTAVNELLENAVKFSCDKTQHAHIHITSHETKIRIEVTNHSDKQDADTLKKFLTVFFSKDFDVNTFFIKQVEKGGNVGYGEGSQLGFYTLSHNYQSQLSARITKTESPEIYKITIAIELEKESAYDHKN
ncbi:MAG: hypothetical protein EXS67_06050 [Candidatus Margulisbacteria bacterium]|nr:hypothetical protein [Candidatus Margulisiibacteriota bacterium]